MKKKEYKALKKSVKIGKAVLTIIDAEEKELPGFMSNVDIKKVSGYDSIDEYKKVVKKAEKKLKKEKVKRFRRKITFNLWK